MKDPSFPEKVQGEKKREVSPPLRANSTEEEEFPPRFLCRKSVDKLCFPFSVCLADVRSPLRSPNKSDKFGFPFSVCLADVRSPFRSLNEFASVGSVSVNLW